MNYCKYRPSLRERLKCIGMTVLLSVVIAYLFYDSVWGLLLCPAIYLVLQRRSMVLGRGRLQEQMGREFLDVLRTVSAALLAGMSMENAWREAGRELVSLYGEASVLGRELAGINSRVELNVPLEGQLEDLANRSGNADIASFAEVFSFAKRSGGNFVTILEGTAEHIRARFETDREIQVLVAAKKLEQKIMNFVPLLILAYLKLSSPGFLDILYGNVAGILFMSGCLLAYAGAILWSEKILKIEM
ncbi:MAG: type II secretion system F family protein [Blautia sp.]|nr:type II secretion system F family protein [Blautia sp.]